jgi:hypothetical protein
MMTVQYRQSKSYKDKNNPTKSKIYSLGIEAQGTWATYRQQQKRDRFSTIS